VLESILPLGLEPLGELVWKFNGHMHYGILKGGMFWYSPHPVPWRRSRVLRNMCYMIRMSAMSNISHQTVRLPDARGITTTAIGMRPLTGLSLSNHSKKRQSLVRCRERLRVTPNCGQDEPT
jgi:hypothetical protein